MSAAAAAAVKAAILALTDENTRKKIGWVLAAILSPVILLIAFLCALGSGTASHNLSVVELCFYGGTVPSETLMSTGPTLRRCARASISWMDPLKISMN